MISTRNSKENEVREKEKEKRIDDKRKRRERKKSRKGKKRGNLCKRIMERKKEKVRENQRKSEKEREKKKKRKRRRNPSKKISLSYFSLVTHSLFQTVIMATHKILLISLSVFVVLSDFVLIQAAKKDNVVNKKDLFGRNTEVKRDSRSRKGRRGLNLFFCSFCELLCYCIQNFASHQN